MSAKRAVAVDGEVVTVSGEGISDSAPNGTRTATAGVRVNSDGTIDKLVDTTYSQIDSSTDWVIPNSYSGTYHVKFTKGGLDPAPTGGTLDTWLALSSSYLVYYDESADDTLNGGTITVEISDDGGSTTLDSGNYPLTATIGLPP
jgi:hypothetical protein